MLQELSKRVGEEIGVTEWFEIDQARINAFADATNDHQWIHVDVERAKAESPFGGPIAHGFLTLSLLPMWLYSLDYLAPGCKATVNYGLNKLRFVNPVKVGARVRNRVTLLEVSERSAGRWQIIMQHTVEIEGEDKPALVAEGITLADY